MSTALILRDNLAFSITPAAHEARERALAASALVSVVRDPESNESATKAMAAIKAVTNAVERARKEAKEPILDAGRQLDAVAKEFVDELNAEYLRVATAVGDYQQVQLEKQRAIERARAEEAARIERERLEEVRRAEEAERQKQLQLKLKADEEARTARNERERIAAEARAKAEQERLAREVEEAKRIAEERAKQQSEALPVAAPVRAEGQIVKPELDFEVYDIHALYRCHPGFVRLEVNRQEVKDALKAGQTNIKGIRVFEVVKVGARANKGKVIDV